MKAHSVRCPECSELSIVLKTHTRVDGVKRRRRVCANGHRFTTYQKTGKREQVKK